MSAYFGETACEGCVHGPACRVIPCSECGKRWHMLGQIEPPPYVCPRCEEAALPCRITRDGWCANHSDTYGPAYCAPGLPATSSEPFTIKRALADVHAWACLRDQHDPVCSILTAAITEGAARLADARSLVADWQANGNSRGLGDPRADVWHKCAAQLLAAIDNRTAEEE